MNGMKNYTQHHEEMETFQLFLYRVFLAYLWGTTAHGNLPSPLGPVTIVERTV